MQLHLDARMIHQAHASGAAAKAAAERAEERASAWRSESQLLRDRLQQLERVRLARALVVPGLSPHVRSIRYGWARHTRHKAGRGMHNTQPTRMCDRQVPTVSVEQY